MKRIIAAIVVLAGLDTGYAAAWEVSAAYADGEFARIVIETTEELRVQCALKNASGTTIAAQPWTVHAPATEVLIATHGQAWKTVTCVARDDASNLVPPAVAQEAEANIASQSDSFPTDGKNPILAGDHQFSMTDNEWFAWNMSGIPECEAVPIYGFDGGDWREVLTWVQTRLTEMGYDPGEVDGNDGPRTRAALQAFVADNGLFQDARLLELNVFAALIPGTCFVPEIAHILKCDEAISSDPGWKLQLKMLNAGRGDALGKIQRNASGRCISGEWTPKQVEQHLAERLKTMR